jgi:hypothetical protein
MGMSKKRTLQKAARELLADPQFLFRVGKQIEAAGVIGENRNRLALYLACLTTALEKPVSMLVKGGTSSGKSNLVKAVLALVPGDLVVSRSSYSGKALAYGAEELEGKIIHIAEHRRGKDAQFYVRLLQSEGVVEHESTVVSGSNRGTVVVARRAEPVFLSTTTDEKIYPDDETRYLSLRTDESAEQTNAIVQAQFRKNESQGMKDMAVWHEVFRILRHQVPNIEYPEWFSSLANHIPSSDTRARRDSPRFLTLMEAVARCRSFSDGRALNSKVLRIDFADYCVAFRILNEAFSYTYRGAHPLALQVAEAVQEFYDEQSQPIAFNQLVSATGWGAPLARKWLKEALEHKLVDELPGARKNNLKLYIPRESSEFRFLPRPSTVLRECAELGTTVTYVDPLTGQRKKLHR